MDILVKFKHHDFYDLFSFSMIELLRDDPNVERIINNSTGVVIFER